MKRSLHTAVIVGILALSFTSCMTIIDSNKADITLIGPTDEPVNINTVSDTFCTRTLPVTIKVLKDDLNKPISVESESYQYAPVIPGRKVSGWSIAQAFAPLPGTIGLLVDGVTGAIYKPRQDLFALAYKAKTDSITQLPPFIMPATVSPLRRHPERLYRNELLLKIGVGGLTSAAYDDFMFDLKEMYNLRESSNTHSGPYVSFAGSYYYHFNHHIALGATLGVEQKSYKLDNLAYCNEMREYAQRYSAEGFYIFPTTDPRYYRTDSPVEVGGNLRSWRLYLTPAVKWTWAYYTNVSLYSRLAFGVSYQHLSFSGQRKDTQLDTERHRWLPAGQLSFIGLEYRHSNLGSFIELGVGNEGILSAGIALRF